MLPCSVLLRAAAGDGYAWDSLEVVYEFCVGPVVQQFGEGLALAVADFNEQPAFGLEGCFCLGDQAAVDV
jgi:hypothetical protein